MAFSLYYVDADLVTPSKTIAGAGAVCKTLSEAHQERELLERNPKYRNVRITCRRYGG